MGSGQGEVLCWEREVETLPANGLWPALQSRLKPQQDPAVWFPSRELWECRGRYREIPAVGNHAGGSQQLFVHGLEGECGVWRKRGCPAGNPKEQGWLGRTSVSSEDTSGRWPQEQRGCTYKAPILWPRTALCLLNTDSKQRRQMLPRSREQRTPSGTTARVTKLRLPRKPSTDTGAAAALPTSPGTKVVLVSPAPLRAIDTNKTGI